MEIVLEAARERFDWREAIRRATTVRDIARIFERVFGGSFPVPPELKALENATAAPMDAQAASRALPVVASVKSGVIKKTDTKSAIQVAQEWVRKNVPKIVDTLIGEVEISEEGIGDSLSHTMYQAKLDAIQAIDLVLKNGEYLGARPDKDGRFIDNHYFAGRVWIGDEDKIVFIRTREKKEGSNRFYVHEVFTDEEIEKVREHFSATDADQLFRNASDFYRFIIAKHLDVKNAKDE